MNKLHIYTVLALVFSVSMVSVAYAGVGNGKTAPGLDKKIAKECVLQGGEYVDGVCVMSEPPVDDPEPTPDPVVSECSTNVECPGSTTAGQGICVIDKKTGMGTCEYLYEQTCTTSPDCAEYLGVEESPYVCCVMNRLEDVRRCNNPGLCTMTAEEFEKLK